MGVGGWGGVVAMLAVRHVLVYPQEVAQWESDKY